MSKNRVIFMGTPKIAAAALAAILSLSDIEIVAVICQPDRLQGRKKQILFCPVKQLALEHNLLVLQTNKLTDLYSKIVDLQPDLIFTCAFGQFIPESILNIPKYKCVNLHASLLPKLRGGAPIHWAIINQFKQTGWTLMYMQKKMDAGNIIKQFPVSIVNDETYISLYDKLTNMIPKIINDNFHLLFNKNLTSIQQNEADVTYGLNISREDEKINWNLPCQQIEAKIRGLYNKPIAYSLFNEKIVKIHKAIISNRKSEFLPGTISSINQQGIYVCTKDFDLILLIIQIESKKPLSISSLINGNHTFVISARFN